jgi:hypothetical protein
MEYKLCRRVSIDIVVHVVANVQQHMRLSQTIYMASIIQIQIDDRRLMDSSPHIKFKFYLIKDTRSGREFP